MPRRNPQARVAQIAAFVFLAVGIVLAAVLVIGLADGVTGTGPLLLATIDLGVFALAGRLTALARRPVLAPPAATAPRQPTPSATNSPASVRPPQPRPQPRPRSRTVIKDRD